MDKITRDVRLAQWAKLIQQCNESGLSKKAWCEQNQISEKSFYYWQRCVRKTLYDQQASLTTTEIMTNFVEVPAIREANTKTESVAAVIRMNGCQIELSNSASREFLNQLLGALVYVQ